jgi:hypothetical protein
MCSIGDVFKGAMSYTPAHSITESELPSDLSKEDSELWYHLSVISKIQPGVRIGPNLIYMRNYFKKP